MATYVIYGGAADGEVYSSHASYATARSGSGLTLRTAYSLVGQYLFSGNYYVHETFMSFDTSSVVETPSSVVLSVKSRTDASTQDFNVYARAVDWGASLTTGDFVAGASLSGNPLRAAFATSAISGSGYQDFTSQSTFKDNLANPVRLLLASDRTEAGTTPTADEYWSIWPANFDGATTDDPKLTIVADPIAKSASDTLSASEGSATVTIAASVSTSDTVAAADSAVMAVAIPVVYGPGRDEFTGSSGTLLTAHTSDSNHAWQTIAGVTSAPELDGSGNARPAVPDSGGANINAALLTYTPPSADYTVTAELSLQTGVVGDLVGFLARANDTVSGSGGYLHPYLYHDTGGVYLGLYNGGTTLFYGLVSTTLGSYSAGTVYTVAVAMAGSAVTLSINGTTAWSGTVSGPLTAGKIGVRCNATTTSTARVGRIELSGLPSAGAAETVTLTEGSTVTDPSTSAKTASDTITAADGYTGLLAKIDPGAASWTQSAWATRAGHSAAGIVKDGGGTRGAAYPMGVQLPNGDIRVWYGDWPGSVCYKTSTDDGATWSSETALDFWGGAPATTTGFGGGLVKVRPSRDGLGLHASINKYTFTGDIGTYPDGSGWDIYYDTYYAYSTDGTTWSTPVILPKSRLSFLGMDVVELPNGDLLITGEELNRGDGAYFRNAGPMQTNCYRSTDGGATWAFHSTVADAAVLGYTSYEPQHDVVDDGTTYGTIILSAARYTGTVGTYDRHIRTSTDGGATWSSPQLIGATTNRGGLCVMPDGDVVLMFSIDGGTSTKWLVSRDKGSTWTDMGSVLAGTSQPANSGSGVYVANKWIDPFPIAGAGVTPNLGVVWGSGYDDIHGSSFYRSFTRGATAAPVVTQGQGTDTVSVSETAAVTVAVGAITKTASDTVAVTDTSGGLAVVYAIGVASDMVAVADSSSTATTVGGVAVSDIFYFMDASGTGVPSTNRRPYWWLHRKRVLL